MQANRCCKPVSRGREQKMNAYYEHAGLEVAVLKELGIVKPVT